MSEVLATIPMAMEPARVAIAPDGSRAYVTTSEVVLVIPVDEPGDVRGAQDARSSDREE